MRDAHILQFVYETPWAILPAKLSAILAVIHRHSAGDKLTPEEIKAATHAAQPRPAARAGAVAILPVFGTIIPRGDMLMESSGAMSTTSIAARFREALADPQVSSILLDIDSPGGAVQGVDELSAEIFKARGQKPITAIANHLAASAAYWIGSSADELVVTPSGEVGSIGVFAVHDDWSAALEQAGIKTTYISAGKFKTEGAPEKPLTEEARDFIQSRVDDYYGMFVRAVARNRGAGVDDVRGGFGEGRVVGAKQAVSLGMADRVATLDETVARMLRTAKPGRSPAAELEFRQRRARANHNV